MLRLAVKLTPLVVISALSTLLYAQEPVKFRGAYIGQPLSDYADCSSGKPKVPKGYRTHGKLCDGSHGYVFHTKVVGHLDPKDSGESFEFDQSKIVRIKIMVPNEDWEKVRYDLSQKMGEPRSEVPESYQNLYGAKWEFNQGLWVKGDTVAAAGIKVMKLFGSTITDPFSNKPSTEGIEINITNAKRAGLPETRPNSLD